ncbi:FecR family protein [Pseudoflavitalea rhizosphaerae]|uniref:FecR family protein n=1 Tax=Pseudoflavitalea rhizosphaerae TaxID=1884793 RepID=UPI000F8C444C|nr:FecR family protein [Pseudoflavitalea rhizosphaerae]
MLNSSDQKYVQELLKRYELGTATAEEIHFVETYFDYQNAMSQQQNPFASDEEKTMLEKEMQAKLLQEIRGEEAPVIPMKRRFPVRWAAAAVLLITTAIAAYLYFRNTGADQPVIAATEQTTPVSRDRAVLKLANGQELQLDSLHGKILQQQHLTVNNDSGMLHYNSNTTKPENHTLYTRNGTQYELQLPDGTHVWLNAASSITYPTIFTGNNRDVTITGEAYFEVARNKNMPFRVMANDMQIEVTGTHFNVNTYTNEPFLTTTLLEGGVNVTRNNNTVQLTPGQQSRSGADGKISVSNDVNTEEVMAWKNGYFHFESASLESIMRQVARWYDLQLVYEGAISKEKYFVIIKRNSSLQAVLKVLEANNVRFTIDGKKLTVKAIQ